MTNYILEGKLPVKCDDVIKWAKTLADDRHVAKTEKDGVRVSTVFLGSGLQFGDGPPVLFETMIFGHDGEKYQERYCTWEEAEEGHKRACGHVGLEVE